MKIIRRRSVGETLHQKQCLVSRLPQVRDQFLAYISRRSVRDTESPHLLAYDFLQLSLVGQYFLLEVVPGKDSAIHVGVGVVADADAFRNERTKLVGADIELCRTGEIGGIES